MFLRLGPRRTPQRPWGPGTSFDRCRLGRAPTQFVAAAGRNNHRSRNYLRAGAEAAFAVPVRGLPQKMNVPSLVAVTMSITPSLFRSTARTSEPAPERLWISSGTNSAPPGAFGFRTVLYTYSTGSP